MPRMTPAASHDRTAALRRMRTALACALFCLAGLWLCPPAPAADADVSDARLLPLDPRLPWHIEADRIRYDQARDEYVAEGEVVIRKQERSIAADTIRYSAQTAMAYAEGRVVVTSGADVLTGSYLELDLESEKGYLDDGVIFLQENNYHIQGNRIQKVGPDLYRLDQGTITTCDGQRPDWKLSGRDIQVHEDGSGTAWNAVAYVLDVPVGYFPFVSFPARNRRQSGLLFPEMGYSERKGAFYNQPFYWAIDDRSDATFYLHYMSERGVKPGLEYRYYLNRDAKGAVMFDFLHDEQIDDGRDNASKDWGYDDSGGVFLRPNRDRYWFRMSHSNPLPAGFRGLLDLDLVSDQDYLREFKKGYMGFEDTELFFKKFMGRTLDDYDDPVRVSRLQVDRRWSKAYLSAGPQLYDDVRKGQNWKEVTQRLPVVRFIAPKQRVHDSAFFYNLNSEYDNFWRDRGFGVQRTDLWPRLYYPQNFRPYFTFEPSFGLRQTLWNQYKIDEADAWSDDEYFHREIYDSRLGLSTEVYNIYAVEDERVSKVKHSVKPELAFTYVPEVDQDRLPNIDARDRLEKRTRVSYALTNTLTSKSLKVTDAAVTDSDAEDIPETIRSPGEYDYHDFMRFKVGQYYDFSREVYNQPARDVNPLSPLFTKLTFYPAAFISLDSEAKYNFHEDRFDLFNAGVTLAGRKKDRLTLEYRYNADTQNAIVDEYETGGFVEQDKTTEEEKVSTLIAKFRLGVTERFALIGSYEYDFVFDRADAYSLGFVYESQCWTLETVFGMDEEDIGIGLRIRLHGIGEFGF
jgi:LPS-assembly protein